MPVLKMDLMKFYFYALWFTTRTWPLQLQIELGLAQLNPLHTLPAQSPQDPFSSRVPIYSSVFRVVSFLWAFPPKPCTFFCPLSHACHMPCRPHSPRFDLPNNIWWWVQIMKLPTVQLLPFSRYFIHLRSKGLNDHLLQNRLLSFIFLCLVNNSCCPHTLCIWLHLVIY
jgi:hypothetical protein